MVVLLTSMPGDHLLTVAHAADERCMMKEVAEVVVADLGVLLGLNDVNVPDPIDLDHGHDVDTVVQLSFAKEFQVGINVGVDLCVG